MPLCVYTQKCSGLAFSTSACLIRLSITAVQGLFSRRDYSAFKNLTPEASAAMNIQVFKEWLFRIKRFSELDPGTPYHSLLCGWKRSKILVVVPTHPIRESPHCSYMRLPLDSCGSTPTFIRLFPTGPQHAYT